VKIKKEDSMKNHPWTIVPTMALGKWSVGLIIAMLILFAIGSLLPEDRSVLVLTMVAVIITGISAFITGLLAMLKQKDKALAVVVSIAIGTLLIWILGGAIIGDLL
jgi:Na+/melibiose symporter-like transporter